MNNNAHVDLFQLSQPFIYNWIHIMSGAHVVPVWEESAHTHCTCAVCVNVLDHVYS